MTKEEIISMLSQALNREWTNGVTCLMVENSDSYIPVIVHHNKNSKRRLHAVSQRVGRRGTPGCLELHAAAGRQLVQQKRDH